MHCCCCLYECVCLLIDTVFLQHLKFISKSEKQGHRIHITLCLHKHKASSYYLILHHGDTFITVSEPTLAYYYQSKLLVCGFILDIVYSIGFDKCIMTYVHNFYIIHYSSTVAIPLNTTVHISLSLNSWQLPVLSPQFCFFQRSYTQDHIVRIFCRLCFSQQ